ncbi:MAG: PQQ-binding-like beta-propeller repeat protein, partial [Thermomicrobiales bacterium]
VANGRVYFTVNDFTLRAVDAATGEEAWRIRVPGLTEEEAQNDEGFHIDASVAVADDTVYAVGSDGVVFAAGTSDGDVKWTFQPDGNPQSASPLVFDGILLVTSIVREQGADGTPGRLSALDAETGSLLWEPKQLSSAAWLTAADGSVFVQIESNEGPSVEAFDIQSGEHQWSFEGGGFLDNPVYVDGDLYVSSNYDGTIQRVDAASGVAEWSVYLNADDTVVINDLVIASGYGSIYAVGGDGDLDAEDASTQPVDLSGLPPCEPPRPMPAAVMEGIPSAAIAAETRLEEREGNPPTTVDGRATYFTEWPQILASNVPTGAAASTAQSTAIQETLRSMAHCWVRPEGNRLLQGYFTDDFFRRGVAAERQDGYAMTWQIQPEESEIKSLHAIALEDGRIAALTSINVTPNLVMIFVQQEGQWVIDELYRIVDEYNFGPLG